MYWTTYLMRIRPVWLAEKLKKWLRVKRGQVSLSSGLKLCIDPVSHFGNEVLRTGTYEPTLSAFISRILRTGDCFLDVGANEAYFSILGARTVGPKGLVLAFEPQSRLFDPITENLQLNRVENVQVVRKALGAKSGEARLFLAPSLNSGATSLISGASTDVTEETVAVVSLDDFLDASGLSEKRFRLMKLDCEGFEGPVLAGASRLLSKQKVDLLVLDFHQRLIGEEKTIAIDTELRRHGYLLSQMTLGTWVYHLPQVSSDLESLGPIKSIPSFVQMYGKSSGVRQAQACTL